ncbi:putative quorum-sensing-regulated virulence factor [Pedobacter gandavensis]|uniref:Uncharacterized protein n=1 Tax=Pedobacter gandavensis TaxID=2679963 RepID=A0ABR6EVF7_9SPHI|nr:DUF3820 family protein [Pedobacter gandavensis]MBB2148799.1 hypothetical protein [Pedobacter gandavensis]
MPESITDNSKMPFGKFKDYPMANVPADYLLFLHDTNRAGRVADYIKADLDVLIKEGKTGKNKRLK